MARPRSPLIDRDHAVRTALAMIDEAGLPAFSLERLGKRLGVKGPSLYHHFTDRADLLSRVARMVILEVPVRFDVERSSAWDEQALAMTLELRRAMLRHPHAIPVVLEHYPRHLTIHTYERFVLTLEAAGVPDEFHLMLFEGLEHLTLGSVSLSDTTRPTDWAALADEGFPAMRRAVDARGYDTAEASFEAACVAFIDGVKARVAASV